jgi:hypothetical protein
MGLTFHSKKRSIVGLYNKVGRQGRSIISSKQTGVRIQPKNVRFLRSLGFIV